MKIIDLLTHPQKNTKKKLHKIVYNKKDIGGDIYSFSEKLFDAMYYDVCKINGSKTDYLAEKTFFMAFSNIELATNNELNLLRVRDSIESYINGISDAWLTYSNNLAALLIMIEYTLMKSNRNNTPYISSLIKDDVRKNVINEKKTNSTVSPFRKNHISEQNADLLPYAVGQATSIPFIKTIDANMDEEDGIEAWDIETSDD